MKKNYLTALFLLLAHTLWAQVAGCTDPLSLNYNPAATVNDGSCTYASAAVAPATSVNLPSAVNETSGLILWDSSLYTHNDSGTTNLYALDASTGAIQQTLPLTGTENQDWEDLAQDDTYIYVGDFGNNANGNRTNLRIFRIEKASLASGSPVIATINFSYSNQTVITPAGSNNTDFDCEALVVSQDSIYLFTKQWVSRQTSVYALPKTPGTHIAQLRDTYNVNGLITGAAYLEDKRLAVLCGYSNTLQPFFFLLYDFEGYDFFGGNKRKIGISLPFHQVEGIATANGLDFYVTNEQFPALNIAHRLHRFDLDTYLREYLDDFPCAVETVWDGTAWSRGLPDSEGYVARMEADYDTAAGGPITACTLTISQGKTVVSSGDNIVLAGALDVKPEASLSLHNNASLLQREAVANSGEITVHRNSSPLYHLDYTLWSSPVSGNRTLKEFSPGTPDERFYVYNTALNAYSNYLSASGIFGGNPGEVTFVPAKGYLIRMPAGLPEGETHIFEGVFTGTPNNGTVTIPLATSGNRYNAVGNPYPSPINIHNFIDANAGQLENGTLYFWRKTNNPGTSSYATVTKLAYAANDAPGGDTGGDAFTGDPALWTINTGQGFFVKAAPAAANLVFANSMRRAVNNDQFFIVPPGNEPISRLWLNITGQQGLFGQAVIGYTDEATSGLDYGWDGLMLGGAQLALYTEVSGIKLAIQARPAFSPADVVPLGYTVPSPGQYAISLDHTDGIMALQDIYLKDRVTGVLHDLKAGAYTFTGAPDDGVARFEIVYENALGGPDWAKSPTIIAWKEGSAVAVTAGPHIITHLTVHDTAGRELYGTDPDAAETRIENLPHGQLLLLTVQTDEGTIANLKVMN